MTVVAGGLITLEYAAEGLNIRGDVGSPAQATRDADLTAYIQAATPIIENIIGPVLQVTKTVSFDGDCTAIVLPDMASSIVSVTENGTALPVGNWFFDPISSTVYGGNTVYPRVFYPGRLAIAITYITGYTTIPANIQLAARELVRFWWQQGKAAQRPAYSDAVESTPPQGFAVPKRVVELLAPNNGVVGFA